MHKPTGLNYFTSSWLSFIWTNLFFSLQLAFVSFVFFSVHRCSIYYCSPFFFFRSPNVSYFMQSLLIRRIWVFALCFFRLSNGYTSQDQQCMEKTKKKWKRNKIAFEWEWWAQRIFIRFTPKTQMIGNINLPYLVLNQWSLPDRERVGVGISQRRRERANDREECRERNRERWRNKGKTWRGYGEREIVCGQKAQSNDQ